MEWPGRLAPVHYGQKKGRRSVRNCTSYDVAIFNVNGNVSTAYNAKYFSGDEEKLVWLTISDDISKVAKETRIPSCVEIAFKRLRASVKCEKNTPVVTKMSKMNRHLKKTLLSRSLNVTTSENILKIVRRPLKMKINESFRVFLEAVPAIISRFSAIFRCKTRPFVIKGSLLCFLDTYNCLTTYFSPFLS